MTTGSLGTDGEEMPLEEFLAQVRRSARAQHRAMRARINEWNQAAPPGCPLALDAGSFVDLGEHGKARQELYARGWRHAYLLAVTIGDHLEAIADMASSRSPRTFAHMTVARAALEAAARLNYVLCPQDDVSDRVLRAAAVLLVSAEEEVRAVADLETARAPIHGAARLAADRRNGEVRDLIARAQVVAVEDKRGRLLSVAWADGSGRKATARLDITGMLRTLLPSKPAAYRVASGVVHSQSWVLEDDAAFDAATRSLNWRPDPAALAGSLDLAISASLLAIETFALMLGQDAHREWIEAQRREQAASRLVWRLL